jgi:hypothetical protein
VAKTGKSFNPSHLRVPPEASTASDHTVDDLFQILVHARGKKPELARRDILKQLQDKGLPIELHIRGGVRSIGPVRQPTPGEQVEEMRTGIATARYNTTPPEGVTLPVDPQSWEGILLLRIRSGKLVIEPGCAFDYPWDAYSFSIANWSLVEELWPNPNRVRSDPPAPAPKSEDLPVPSTTVPEPALEPKMRRSDWIEAYLTKEKGKELVDKYDRVGKAAEAVNYTMEADPKVDAFKNSRSIEPFLITAKLYPPRRSSK